MLRRAAIWIVPALLALAGCGNSRIPVPRLDRPLAPTGFRSLQLPSAGVSLLVPRNWAVLTKHGPMLAVVSSGPAVISVSRYPGASPPVTGTAALEAARTALLGAARTGHPHLDLVRSGLVTAAGHGAVELDTLQRLDGRLRRVRSTHVYLSGEEVVLEEFAPPVLFHAVDHTVFSPVRRSLRLLAGGGGGR